MQGTWEFERKFELHDELTSSRRDIAIRSDGDIVITGKTKTKVHVYNRDGQYQLSLDSKEQLPPAAESGSDAPFES